MKILLIDADSTIPNIALMKLSTYHKATGDEVSLIRCNLPYYPNRKKTQYHTPDGYDRYYASVIFKGNKEFILGDQITFGGTGVDLTTTLPEGVDDLECDYSIYPDNDTSYGFLSRGCIRKCYFCVVPKKEGTTVFSNTIDEIVRHKKVKFMDNNFLSMPGHKEILKELISKKLKVQFNQGLDIRLVDKENGYLLSKLNYLGDYLFAFDSWRIAYILEKKLRFMKWRRPFQFKFFVYIDPKTKTVLSDAVKRVEWLRKNKLLPYIMRDVACWTSDENHFYIDLAAYCNQVNLFKSMSFDQFLNKRYKNKKRIEFSSDLYRRGLNEQ